MFNSHQAYLRHAAYYRDVLSQIHELYRRGHMDGELALQQFDQERANIEMGQAQAEKHATEYDEAAAICSDYPDVAANLLDLRLHPRERIRWVQAAIAAAKRRNDLEAQARHLNHLGLAYHKLGRSRRSLKIHRRQLSIARKAADRRCEATALCNLGLAHAALYQYADAIPLYQE
ncbi:MAG TPA: tetratricopeptide repeat protein, partial [Blastocatellia bacterium]|nr:tetratricopeptide repeat protein [Blastocatellia bacterium]